VDKRTELWAPLSKFKDEEQNRAGSQSLEGRGRTHWQSLLRREVTTTATEMVVTSRGIRGESHYLNGINKREKRIFPELRGVPFQYDKEEEAQPRSCI